MALTVTNTVLDHPGGIRFSSGVITGDSAYVAGGEAITPDDLGFDSAIVSLVLEVSDDGYVARFDPDANTVEVFRTGDAVNQRTYSTAGGAAGNITATGVLLTDTLVSVLHHTPQVENTTRTYAIAGGSAGNHTVTGVLAADVLVSVVHHTVTTAAVADLTSEFTVDSNNTIDNGGNTDTTNDWLVVTVRTPAVNALIADLTSEFTISANNQINNSAGTATTNDLLVVTVSRGSAFSEVDTSVNLSASDFSYIAIGY